MSVFDDIDVAQLRARRSAKWTMIPPDVLPAWVAEMDFPLDPGIRTALGEAIAQDDCGYANGAGVAAAFAGFAAGWFGWTVEPRGVFVLPDVLVGIAEILKALTKPGDRVVVNSPVYPPFFRTVREVERTVEDVPLRRDERIYSARTIVISTICVSPSSHKRITPSACSAPSTRIPAAPAAVEICITEI